MSVISNNQLAGASGQGGSGPYEIQRSLRFNSGDQSSLSRTPSSASNRRTWTWSGWVKRSVLVSGNSPNKELFIAEGNSDTTHFQLGFRADGIYVANHSTILRQTTAKYRDTSAWYHIVLAVDTTQSTANDRIKLYVNGAQVTAFDSNSNPGQNTDTGVNSTAKHNIGEEHGGTYFDGYMADVHFIDGQALAPTNFGKFDENNVWQPKAYSGSHGTNGFHLDFSDPSDLGDDAAGSNNWTPNNLAGTAPGLSTANQGMDVVTYTGNSSSGRNITGLAFTPDFVWIKNRTNTGGYNNILVDSNRGAGKYLVSNGTNAESTYGYVSALNSGGFTVSNHTEVNGSGNGYVAWCWKAGGSASTNTNGTIQSSVSANNTYGFSIATWTGNGSSNQSVGHGLTTAPSLVAIKCRSTATSWHTYVRSLDSTGRYQLYLNSSDAKADFGSPFFDADSSKINLYGGTSAGINGNNSTYVAYCWSEISGFSKFGSYTGNGSSTGPTVTTGFKPRWIMVKGSSYASHWNIFDTARSTSNPRSKVLRADSYAAEFDTPTGTYGVAVDVLNDGFQLKSGSSTNDVNQTNETYIYAAFADKPDQSIIDSLIDTPTDVENDSGNNGGNYATLNPIDHRNLSNGPTYSLSDGNLTCNITGGSSNSSTARGLCTSTIELQSGKKWYCEVDCASLSNNDFALGIASPIVEGYYAVSGGKPGAYLLRQNGNFYHPTGQTGAAGSRVYNSGDTIGIAVDLSSSTKTITFYKNGSSLYSYNVDLDQGPFFFAAGTDAGGGNTYKIHCNFGQRSFQYTPPSGYKSLCTTNLADPTIADGSTAMDAKLYTGNGGNQSITGLGFSPDLVWIKNRSSYTNQGHAIFDVQRGKQMLSSAATANEANYHGSNGLPYRGYVDSFDANGFSLVKNSASNLTDYVNYNNATYVGWAWDAGSSSATNDNGSIQSTVRANQSAGFSIVTGSGNSGTVGHGLNAKPDLVIVKQRNGSVAWAVTHSALGAMKDNIIYLNGTSGNTTSSNFWGSANFDSSVFSISSNILTSGATFVAYCFTAVSGYSSFGKYTGNGSADGPFVYTGFKPKWIMIKRTNSAKQWVIMDTERDSYNVSDSVLQANDTAAEWSNSENDFDILSNGFKMRNSHDSKNGNNDTYIYAAFAEHPFKSARAR